MAYDPTKEQTVVISKEQHTMLKDLAQRQKRNLRTTLELLIQNEYEQNNKS